MEITKQMTNQWGKYTRTFKIPDFEKKRIVLGGNDECPVCEAPKDFIIHHGFRKNIKGYTQRYFCLWCFKAWSENNDMHRMRNKKETIEKALNLRQQGYSLRDIKIKLKNAVSSTTIMRWIKKWNKNKNQKKTKKTIVILVLKELTSPTIFITYDKSSIQKISFIFNEAFKIMFQMVVWFGLGKDG